MFDGQIMLGNIIKPHGYLTKPTPIPQSNELHRISPQVWSARRTEGSSIESATLWPSEFRQGPPVNIDDRFYSEIAKCLCENRLENTLGLEAIQDPARMKIEFSTSMGSILLMKEKVNAEIIMQHTTKVTGWVVTVEKGASFRLTEDTECVVGPGPNGGEEHRRISLPPVKSKDLDMENYIYSLCKAQQHPNS